jgi:hypothetical protein
VFIGLTASRFIYALINSPAHVLKESAEHARINDPNLVP